MIPIRFISLILKFPIRPEQYFPGLLRIGRYPSSAFVRDEKDLAFRARLRKDWIVDEAKMSRTNNAIFMHCLPVRRNVIVTDGVIDSAASVVIAEAENRLHVQKAILTKVLSS